MGTVTWHDYKTPSNNYCEGNIMCLDRHEIDCGSRGEILVGFGMKRNGNTMHYEYKCARGFSMPAFTKGYSDDFGGFEYISVDGRLVRKHTGDYVAHADDVKRSVNYLDRHNLDCPHNWALWRFKGRRMFHNYQKK